MTAGSDPGAVLSFLLALTPAERLEALRNLHGANPLVSRTFVISGVIAVILLLILLFVVHYGQAWLHYTRNRKGFVELSKRNGLSEAEQKLLEIVIAKAGVSSPDNIFTMPAAFDKGVNTLLVEELNSENQRRQKEIQDVLISIRSKLGFGSAAEPVLATSKRLPAGSSRQIPIGKTIQLTRRKQGNNEKIDAYVISTNELEFTVKMPIFFKSKAGEAWNLQYNYGPSLWEFNAVLIRVQGDEFVFGHSDDVRFISRRRFVRVAVNRKAMLARFPFDKGYELEKPAFIPARLKELAGPGLLVITDTQLNVGERVIVITELPNDKVIEDIGQVRHTRPVEQGYSSAIELTGVGESQVDELIRATNTAMIATKNYPEAVMVKA